MKFLKLLGIALAIPLALCTALAQSWQPVATTGPASAGVPLLLTDGSVMVHNSDSSAWWKLTPNISGDYAHGTWTQIASLPAGYGPLYYASAVLPDGRVFVMGGEYNFGVAVWTNRGAIYDPTTDLWTPISAPPGWLQLGDAQCAILPDGRLMLADPFNTSSAILDLNTMIWTAVGPGKVDRFDEEGWTLMPDGSLLTVDALSAPNAERYIPSLDQWINAGATPVRLEDPTSQELGPMVLRPDGTVFATGATGHTCIYTPGAALTDPGTWVQGPDFPIIGGQQLDIADGPACLLPSGNVLCGASPGVFLANTRFFEFDGTALNPVPATPRSPGNPSYVGNMLMLPTGQVLYTDFSSDVEIYTPASGVGSDTWRPTISSVPTNLSPGQTFVIQGTQFNGLSQCSAYGDDSTNATNYPLVRITNIATGHVAYCRTFDHSTMAVATGAAPTFTNVTVPTTIEGGLSTIEVVTNGIASFPAAISIGVGNTNFPVIQTISPSTVEAALPGFTIAVNGVNFQDGDTVTWNVGTTTTPLATTFVSANQLTAVVTADLVANQGTAGVQVSRADGTISNVAGFTITTDVPTISAITPNTVQAFTAAFDMTVSGFHFRDGDVVTWTNGTTVTPLATTFGSSTLLTAAVPASLIANAGTATVQVTRANGRVSNTTTFTITPDSPVLLAMTPATVAAGSPDVTITLSGQRFNSGDVVNWTFSGPANQLATTFVSSSTLTAVVPAALLANGGNAVVTVVDARGQVSGGLIFTITPPLPVLDAISPSSVAAGTPTFTLTANGSSFANTSQVFWQVAGGIKIALTTTYISPTTLTATVPGSLVTAQGRANVFISTPGAGVSVTSLAILITPSLTLTSISPNNQVAGTTFTLTAKGAGFLAGAQVRINGTLVVANVASATQLTATIPGSAIPFGGTTTVAIVNPGNDVSNALAFTIQNPSPRITSLNPSTVKLGSGTFTITITGTGFQPTSVATWSGKNIPTTYISATQLTAVVDASLFPKVGSYTVGVKNPSPGGGGSNGVNVTVN